MTSVRSTVNGPRADCTNIGTFDVTNDVTALKIRAGKKPPAPPNEVGAERIHQTKHTEGEEKDKKVTSAVRSSIFAASTTQEKPNISE